MVIADHATSFQRPAPSGEPRRLFPGMNSVKFVDCVAIDTTKLSLAALDRRTIAIQVAVAGESRVLLGRGRLELDCNFGNVLKIDFPLSTGCEMMIIEDRWNGE